MNYFLTLLLCITLSSHSDLIGAQSSLPLTSDTSETDEFESIAHSTDPEFTLKTNFQDSLAHLNFTSQILGVSISKSQVIEVDTIEKVEESFIPYIKFDLLQSPHVSLDIYKQTAGWKLLESLNIQIESRNTGKQSQDINGKKVILTLKDDVTLSQKISDMAYYALIATKHASVSVLCTVRTGTENLTRILGVDDFE